MTEKNLTTPELFRFLSPFLAECRATLIGIGLVTVAVVGITYIEPLLQRNFINALAAGNGATAWLAGATVLACLGIRNLLSGWNSTRCNTVASSVTLSVKSALARRLLDLPLGFLDHHGSGYLSGRFSADTENMQFFYSTGIWLAAENVCKLAGGLFFLFWLDWKIGLIALGALPFYLMLSLSFKRRQYRLGLDLSEAAAANSRRLNNSLAGAALVKASAAEEQVAAALTGEFRTLAELKIRRFNLNVCFNLLLRILPGLAQGALILFGIHMILAGRWQLGELWALNRYLEFVFAPARQLTGNATQMHFAMAAAARVVALFETTPEPRLDSGLAPARLEGRIEFDRVSFAYPGHGELLHAVSFTIRPGETVALTGPSGCGKSTLAAMIPGLYEPTGGVIRIDGLPLADYNIRALRRRIGCITQNTEFIRGTLAENLQIGAACPIPPETMLRALEAVGLAELTARLPGGLNHELRENGRNFSGGEKLRLTVARELLAGADILIFDEATANLDHENERLILDMIRERLRDRTILLISHRELPLAYAERVFHLSHGDLTVTAHA